MRFYKIGLSNLPDVDVNSAKYEFELIQASLQNLKFKDTIIIVGGKFSQLDEQIIPQLDKYKLKIFIATDTISIASCKHIIELCDVLLHQCPYNDIPNINIKQRYSYIPELFYEDRPVKYKDDLLFFGGSFRDVKDTVLDYANAIDTKLILKNETYDYRLPYLQYIQELDTHKYGLVILRKCNHIKGWITSRFVEYISSMVFPIVHYEYDECDYFNCIKTKNGTEAKSLINFLNKNPTVRTNYIQNYKERFEKDKNKIVEIISEEYYVKINKTL